MILALIPEWLTGFNFLMALFGLAIVVGAAVIVILARGKVDVSQMQVDRANAAEGLVKLRDAEVERLGKELAETEAELESVTAEHRALAGIILGQLLEHWAEKEQLEANLMDLKRQVRILEKRKDGDS